MEIEKTTETSAVGQTQGSVSFRRRFHQTGFQKLSRKAQRQVPPPRKRRYFVDKYNLRVNDGFPDQQC